MKKIFVFLLIFIGNLQANSFLQDHIDFFSQQKTHNEKLMSSHEEIEQYHFYKGKAEAYLEMIQFYEFLDENI